MTIIDTEAEAFFADARAALTADEPKPEVVGPIPDLSDLTDMPDGPPPKWQLTHAENFSKRALEGELEARSRAEAQAFARGAGYIQATGKGIRPWHSSIHSAVVGQLAAAEEAAPESDRPWHAARLDAYAAAYGLKGWYRTTYERGDHHVQVNRIRTAADGDRGRYRVVRDGSQYLVLDLDVEGPKRNVFATPSKNTACNWVEEREGAR
ncbi:hypothetical protein OIU91_06350 [Streptomyces sp. NBC_01456]|uniref:hypothetical protein n=1 Tax=Streptomyces sp. NBC_01456 TaxID=2975868 RepID=UPI002E34142B|nr:hypothetical protein [Streptomyces sp. NBC_01456]